LEDLLGSIKKWTSRLIGKWLANQPESTRPNGPTHNRPRFWQYESYDRIIRDEEELMGFRDYIAKPRAAKKTGRRPRKDG
jgi:type I restriction enzyme R subunit